MTQRTALIALIALTVVAVVTTTVYLVSRDSGTAQPGNQIAAVQAVPDLPNQPDDPPAAAVDRASPPDAVPPAAPSQQPIDLAFGAYQRYHFLEAFEHALPLAEAGNPAAQTLLGMLYIEGFGIPQNLVEAAGWFELAANAGDATAQLQLGLAYLDGAGVEADRSRPPIILRWQGRWASPRPCTISAFSISKAR